MADLWGWDFSGSKPSVAQAQRAGVSVIWVYLHNDWRGFPSAAAGLAYCNAFRSANILVEGVYEASAGELTDEPQLGFAHGYEARRVARSWGFPDWQRLHAATDVNLGPSQYGRRADYQREFNRGVGSLGTGYDEADAIDYMHAQGVLAGGTAWQSGAQYWSTDSGRFRISPNAWAIQLVGNYTDHQGLSIDDNKILLPYPTSLSDPTPIPLPEDDMGYAQWTAEEKAAQALDIAKEVRRELSGVNDVNRGQKFPNGKMHSDDEGDTLGDVMVQLTSDSEGTARRALNDVYRHTPGLDPNA